MGKIRLEKALAVFFFAAVFLYFYHPLKSGDFWWHLASGRWICQNNALPSDDPFAYTTTTKTAERTAVVLKGYWLSQSAYYAIYKLAGFHGLVLFNASIFTLMLFALWRVMIYQGTGALAGLVMVAAVVPFVGYYDELRPQSLTFLFVLVLFYLLEKGLQRLKEGRRPTPLLAIPLLIIPWANAHRGFIIIYAVLGAYLVGESLTHLLRARLPRFGLFAGWVLLCMLLTLINPGLTSPLAVGLEEMTHIWTKFDNIVELESPWKYAATYGGWDYIFILALVALGTTAAMAASWRKVEFTHVVLFAGFAAGGAKTVRLAMFFVLFSLSVASRYAPDISALGALSKRLRRAGTVFVSGFIIFFIVSFQKEMPKGGSYYYGEILPVEAADFIEQKGLPQPILNPFEWGGYLSWRLYPDYKVFTDARFLDPWVYRHYGALRQGRAMEMLNAFGIKSVVFFPIKDGFIQGLVLSLMKDDVNWRLVHLDGAAVIFVRAGEAPALQTVDKLDLAEYLISFANYEVGLGIPGGYSHLDQIYDAMGGTAPFSPDN